MNFQAGESYITRSGQQTAKLELRERQYGTCLVDPITHDCWDHYGHCISVTSDARRYMMQLIRRV